MTGRKYSSEPPAPARGTSAFLQGRAPEHLAKHHPPPGPPAPPQQGPEPDPAVRPAGHADSDTVVCLPAEGVGGLKTGEALVGDAYWDGALGKAVIMLAVPIREADGRFVAAFAAKLNLHAVVDLLQRLSPHDSGDIAVLTDQGKLVLR